MATETSREPSRREEQTTVGTVGALWRYPVKSMLGERRDVVTVTRSGVVGDRVWALRDTASGRIASAKRFPRLLDFRATYAEEPSLDRPGRIVITLPGG